MIVTTGDKTDNRWQWVVPGDKLTKGDEGVQRVTTGYKYNIDVLLLDLSGYTRYIS